MGKTRGSYLIGSDDLEPELAQEIQIVGILSRKLNEEVDKLSRQSDLLREFILQFNKEENSKFRHEVRTTLTEHFEYIKELHNQIESQMGKNRLE